MVVMQKTFLLTFTVEMRQCALCKVFIVGYAFSEAQ